jgi:hypothetical protein
LEFCARISKKTNLDLDMSRWFHDLRVA